MSTTQVQHHQRGWPVLAVLIAAMVAACAVLGLVWLREAEASYVDGDRRATTLETVVEVSERYYEETGQMPASAGQLLDWVDGEGARFAAGGQGQLDEQRRRIGAVRIGTKDDGAWCAVVLEQRPSELSLLAGIPESMASTAVAGPYAGIDHDTNPADCVAARDPDDRAGVAP